jgi:hypothetical protein
MAADLLQAVADVGDELQRRVSDICFVPGLVGEKPVPIVVARKLAQEPEKGWREVWLL